MVATAILVLAQVTLDVISAVLASEYVPVAVYCCFAATSIVAVFGITVIDCRIGAVTVSAAVSLIESNVAVMSVLPSLTPVAKPAAGSMVATAVLELVQVTLDVISAVLASEYVPVAVYC
jgi:hypothetical protein